MRIDLQTGLWVEMRIMSSEDLLNQATAKVKTVTHKYSGNMSLGERKRLRISEREQFVDVRLGTDTSA